MTGRRDVVVVALVTLLLLSPAITNGFPLMFPDSGTYLGIATGNDYAIDRSSYYGLLLKPFVGLARDAGGLWIALVAQSLAIATVLFAVSRGIVGSPRRAALACGLAVMLTSLPWHSGQMMPDAFTGPLVLIACAVASRPAGAQANLLMWVTAFLLSLLHYTHLVLLPATVIAAGWAQVPAGLPWRAALRRSAAAIGMSALAFATMGVTNGLAIGRWSVAPAGPVFLFARLHEDGLAYRWLDRHCGVDAPALLCAERQLIPRDSQQLLWRAPHAPVARYVWQARNEGERWRWVAMFATAGRGAIRDEPFVFLANLTAATVRQFVSFAALDDECPAGCGRDRRAGVGFVLARDRPAALPSLDGSMQLRDTIPRQAIRAITTPVAGIALLLMPFAFYRAWRRRDRTALGFLTGAGVALLANAMLAGALSDVHDRYQSRIVWIVPLILLLLALRRRGVGCPPRPPGA